MLKDIQKYEALSNGLCSNDFIILQDKDELSLELEKISKLFIISTPKTPTYKTYINSCH